MTGTIITKRGIALISKLLASQQKLIFTRAAVGTGSIPGGYDPAGMTGLNQYKMDAEISGYSAEGEEATVVFQISSSNVEEGFIITEAGLFAEDPDEGEILYSYLDLSDDPQYVYAKNSVVQKFAEIEFKTIIGSIENMTVIMSPGALITKEQFDATIDELDKKKITANGGDISETVSSIQEPEQASQKYPEIGENESTKGILGKLYRHAKSLKADKVDAAGGDIANTKVSAFAEVSGEFPAPAAGEASKTLWGKMKKFVEDFKAWYIGVCLIGHIVNNCTSTAVNLPLSAAQGKALMDLFTQLNSDKVTNNDSGQSIAIGWTNNVAPLLVNGAWKGNIAVTADIEDAEKYKMTHNAAVLGLPPGYYYLYDDCTGLPESSGNFYGEIHMVDSLYKTVKLIPADVNKHYYYMAKSFYGSWTGWECYHQHNGRDYQWVDAGTNVNTEIVTSNYSYGFKKSGIGVLYVNFICTPKNKGWPHVFGTGFRPRDVRNVYTHTSRNELVQLQLKTNGDLNIDCGNLTTGESCEIRAQIIMSVDD